MTLVLTLAFTYLVVIFYHLVFLIEHILRNRHTIRYQQLSTDYLRTGTLERTHQARLGNDTKMSTPDPDGLSDLTDETSVARKSDMDVVAERASVKAEIMTLIQPWKYDNEDPLLSNSDMIVMAILCSDHQAMRKTDIVRWVLRNFGYYNEKLIDACLDEGDVGYDEVMAWIIEGFQDAFDEYEIPLQKMYRKAEEDEVFSVSANAERVFLRKWLEPARHGIFPFLKLPAELRNVIYELLLTYYHPLHLRLTRERRRDVTLEMTSEYHNDRIADHLPTSWTPEDPEPKRLEPWAEVLALLVTCKQVFAEAMPCFYSMNTFHFDFETMNYVLAKMPTQRVEHLRMIELSIDARYVLKLFREAMSKLGLLQKLRTLKIEATDQDWLDLHKKSREVLGGRKAAYTKIAQIPGFADLALAASRADELVFGGDCPLIEVYVREEVARLKSTAAGTGMRMKRRAMRTAKIARQYDDGDDVVVKRPKRKTIQAVESS